MIAAGKALRQRRQQNGAERHAQHARRELHQAIGVIHPGNRAGDEKRGENSIDDQRNLTDGNAEDRRSHLPHHAPDARILQVNARQHQHADLLQVRQLVEKLQHAARDHRPRQRHHRRMEVRRGEERKANHADIQQRGREGGNGKAVPGIEDRARQRGQRNQQNIGKGDAQQRAGKRELIGGIGKTGGGDQNHPRRGEHPRNGHQRQRQRQQAGDVGDKEPRRLFALLAFILGEDRHERLRKGAFGENTPQQVRQLKGDEKGVRGHPGAEHPRHNGVTGKTQYAGKQGHGTDRCQRF